MAPSFGEHSLEHALTFILMILGAVGTLLVIRFLGSFRLAALIFLTCNLGGLLLFAVMEKVPVSGTFLWFAGLGLFGFYLFGLSIGKYWFLVVLACQMYVIYLFRDVPNLTPVGMSREEFVNIFRGDVLGSTLAIWVIAILYELQRRKSEHDLAQAQHELLMHREKVMHDARLTELGQMAGGVAHEINNPLAIIHGFGIRLKKDLQYHRELTDEQISMFQSIERSCQRIATISRALLSYAHEDSYEQDLSFTLQKLTEESLELCQERIKSRNIKFQVDCAEANQQLSGKYVKLLQVVVNLINNAIDAVSERDVRWIHIKLELAKHGLTAMVSDSGPGVPIHLRERIKSPFFTTKPVGKGTGLGLSIVDGIMRDIVGEFYLDTSADCTRFVVKFPLAISCTDKKTAQGSVPQHA